MDPSVCIRRALDAYRVRAWCVKGPRCWCGCNERVHWKHVGNVERLFPTKHHISTPRRPFACPCIETEFQCIPQTLLEFKHYLQTRGPALVVYMPFLWQVVIDRGEDWTITLLTYSPTGSIVTKENGWRAPSMLLDLGKRDYWTAVDKVFAWPITCSHFNEHYIQYLLHLKKSLLSFHIPYAHATVPLTLTQRMRLLHNPALAEKMAPHLAKLRWTLVVWWLRLSKRIRPLPKPAISAFPTVLHRVISTSYITPVAKLYRDLLSWVQFLAMHDVMLLRILLFHVSMKDRAQWTMDVVEIVAASGRVQLLDDRLRKFFQWSNTILQMQKTWQWLEQPAFAIPRIAKTLIYHATRLLNRPDMSRKTKTEYIRGLFRSKVMLATIGHNAQWLSGKMPEHLVGHWCRHPKHPVVAAAMRATPIGQGICRRQTIQAAATLAHFFAYRVSLSKLRSINRSECIVCWNKRILWSLHGERKHSVCKRCMQRLRMNGTHACPMCRCHI